MAGLAEARRQGRKGGRPPSFTAADILAARALMAEGKLPVRTVAKRMGVSVATLYRHVGRQDSWHEHGARAAESAPILESLAVLNATDSADIDTRWLSEAGHSGLLVAVLGSISERDTTALTRMRHSAGSAMAVALDVDGWATGSDRPSTLSTAQNTAWLGANGWRAVSAGPEDPLPSVWQELGAAGRAGSGRAGAGADPTTVPTVSGAAT